MLGRGASMLRLTHPTGIAARGRRTLDWHLSRRCRLAVAFVMLAVVHPATLPRVAGAQIARLPPTHDEVTGTVEPLANASDIAKGLEDRSFELAVPPTTPEEGEVDAAAPAKTIPGAKPGIWQRTWFDAVWLAPGGATGMGMLDVSTSLMLAFPMLTRESPLLLTPGFALHELSGPAAPDVPAQLYDATLEIRWLRPLGPRWTMDLAVAPGVFSDFERSSGDSLRIPGRGLGVFTLSPTTKLLAGVAFPDRQDVGLLPVGGMLWTPNDDTAFEIIMPRPRIARRFLYDPCLEWWGYVAGEFGGGQWSVVRDSGADDTLSYFDLRLVVGLERRAGAHHKLWIEAGYVFDRQLEYAESDTETDLDDTALVRGGLAF